MPEQNIHLEYLGTSTHLILYDSFHGYLAHIYILPQNIFLQNHIYQIQSEKSLKIITTSLKLHNRKQTIRLHIFA